MLMSILMHGLIVAVILQPSGDRRKAAAVMLSGVAFVEATYSWGLIGDHWYYLLAIVTAVIVSIALTLFNCTKLVDGLHNACAAMIIINIVDWVLYGYSAVVSDVVYEVVFAAIYLYVWYVMLGKGGADVIGRFKQLRDGGGVVYNTGSAKQCSRNDHKV